MNAIPIWFGPANRPLFGWLYLPEKASAGVVLCRPIGVEALSSHRAYRCLAEDLASLGVVTLQFDYTGTGDSAGDLADLITTDTWLSDIRAATEYVRQTGVSRVGMVGLRLGATLAANSAVGNIEALVLWDPCDTGRRFLREQRMLAAAMDTTPAEGSTLDGRVEIPGLLLPAGVAEAISALSLEVPAGSLARHLLLINRPDRPSNAQVLKRLSTENLERGEAVGQEQFIDVQPGDAIIPEHVIAHIASWLSRMLHIDADADIVPTQPEPFCQAAVLRPRDGRSVVERTVRIGPDCLFGILTEPQDAELAPMRAVLLVNTGMLPHSGPARVWVELARSWAARNMRVLRVDLGGLGDSPTRPGRHPDVLFPAEAAEDLIDAARFMAPEDPGGVVPVGLCSGAYHILEAGLSLRFREAWLINPGAPRDPLATRARDSLGPRQQAIRPLSPIAKRFRASGELARVSSAILPAAGWWVLDKIRAYPSLGGALATAVDNGTELLVICAKPEFSVLEKRSRWLVRRLQRSGRCHFKVASSAEHSLFNFAGRSEVMELLSAQALQNLVPNSKLPKFKSDTKHSQTGHTTRLS